MLNSLNFCLPGNLLISPSNLKESLVGYSILGCSFFLFNILNISCHSLLVCRGSVEKVADNLLGVPLCVICHFTLVAFNILSLSLIFVSLITMCLGVFQDTHQVYCVWDSLCFLDWVDYFLSHVQEFFSYYLFKYFLRSFLFLFSFWNLYNVKAGELNVFPVFP